MKQCLNVLLDEAGIVIALMEDRIVEDTLQELEVVVEADDPIILEGLLH